MLRPLDSDCLWKLDGRAAHIDFLRTKSLDYPVCLPWLHEQDLDHLTLEFLGKFNQMSSCVTFHLINDLLYKVGSKQNLGPTISRIRGQVKTKDLLDSNENFEFASLSLPDVNMH